MVQKSRNVYANYKGNGKFERVFYTDTHVEEMSNEWYEERREGGRISQRIKDILVKYDIDLDKALVLDRVEIDGVVVGYQLIKTLEMSEISSTRFLHS